MYVKELALAVVDGIVSIPADLAYGLRRTFEDLGGSGQTVRLENAAERQRVLNVIKQAFDFSKSDAGPIAKIVKIILDEFYGKLSDELLEKIAKKAGIGTVFLGARTTTQVALVNAISKILTEQIAIAFIAKRFAKLGVGVALTALLIQGLLERASESTKKLFSSHPKIYIELKGQNLDMAYFIVEDAMAPIMEAIKVYNIDKKRFKQLLKDIENNYVD